MPPERYHRRPFSLRRDRRQVAAHLKKIASGSANVDRAVDEILAGVRAQKEGLRAGMSQGREKTLTELNSKYRPDGLRALPFDGFFEAGALDWAEAYAVPLGLADECRERGFEGLLEVRVVRLVVGMTLSLIHSQISSGRLPEIGDAYDLWHAIKASTADVFVTNDDRFFGHIKRMPGVTGLLVVKSVREVLAALPAIRSD